MLSGELMAQALATMAQAFDALRAELTPVQPDVEMTAAQAQRESGYSRTVIAQWCRAGRIAGAHQRARRCGWRFPRRSWERFLHGRGHLKAAA